MLRVELLAVTYQIQVVSHCGWHLGFRIDLAERGWRHCQPHELLGVDGAHRGDRQRSFNKLERELGWRPAESFESGIGKTVRWYLEHQEWTSRVASGAYRDWVAQHYSD